MTNASKFRCIGFLPFVLFGSNVVAEPPMQTPAENMHAPSPIAPTPVIAPLALAPAGLVRINRVEPTIAVDLRYATTRNFTFRALYPPDMPALARPSVARRLAAAQTFLRQRGYGLKIWDAYRPKAAQEELWRLLPNNKYVANPADGVGSLHTWGVAIDATLVDSEGREMEMPTDFDAFTPAAMMHYKGGDPVVRAHLFILQKAMGRAGFYGFSKEWWHFVSRDWKQYQTVPEIQFATPLQPLPTETPLPGQTPTSSAATEDAAPAKAKDPSR
ncbi:MAG: M15 family metallopeptidase [Chthoniobacterales bacterium]